MINITRLIEETVELTYYALLYQINFQVIFNGEIFDGEMNEINIFDNISATSLNNKFVNNVRSNKK